VPAAAEESLPGPNPPTATLDRLNAVLTKAPLHRWLGCLATCLEDETGTVHLAVPDRPELRHSDEGDGLHGGIIAAFIDISAHTALNAVAGINMPTIDLRVDYLAAAFAPLSARATPRRIGHSIGVVDTEVFGRDGKLVALGRAVFRSRRPGTRGSEPRGEAG
jgi:uncharacterized protein (TIGR00369 family)